MVTYALKEFLPSPADTAPPAARTAEEKDLKVDEMHQTAQCKRVNTCLHAPLCISDQKVQYAQGEVCFNTE